MSKRELDRQPGWSRQLDEQIANGGIWTPAGLFGLLDRPELANKIGERLSGEGRERAIAEIELWLCGELVFQDYFTPITDAAAPEQYKELVAKYRAEAHRLGIPDSVPVLYRVRAGFTIERHAPLAGPCHEDFRYLENSEYAQKPTGDLWLFVIPCLLNDSSGKPVDILYVLLRDIRERLALPQHHMSCFGSAELMAGFLLAHFKATGRHLLPKNCFVRTDTCGHRVLFGWRKGKLICDLLEWFASSCSGLCIIAMGVEPG